MGPVDMGANLFQGAAVCLSALPHKVCAVFLAQHARFVSQGSMSEDLSRNKSFGVPQEETEITEK